MAGITKNFIVKNGLEVNGGLLIASTDDNKVGVGTTVLTHDFNVRGGIGVTHAIVTGITTVNELKSTYSQLGVATASYYRVGTSTVFETSGGLVSLSGIQTIDATAKATLQNALFSGQATINNLEVTGVGTFLNAADVDNLLNVNGQSQLTNLYVSGISTFVGVSTYQNTLFGTQLSVSGISTLSSLVVGSAVTIASGGLDVTGVVTAISARVGSAVTITSGGIDVTGIVTVPNLNSTQASLTNLNVSGVATAASLNVTGSSTLSSAVIGSGVTINSGGINVTGVTTFASHLKILSVDQGGGLFAGVVTAANGGQPVVYFGDGSNLTGVNAAPNLGISTAGAYIGAGVTLLNFRGSGVSTVFTNFASGVGTIFIEGGAVTPGGSNTNVQFNNNGALGGSSNFVFDGSNVGIGTTILVNTLQVLGGIGATTLDVTGISTLRGLVKVDGELFMPSNNRIVLNYSGTTPNGLVMRWTGAFGSEIVDVGGQSLTLSPDTNKSIFLKDDLTTFATFNGGGTLISGVTTSSGVNVTSGNDYKVNGTSVLSSTTLGSGVVNSSLTSVGSLGSLTVTGASTLSSAVVGSAVTIASGGINVTGIITGTSAIIGSGTTLTSGGVNAVGVVTATSHDTKGTGSYKIGGTDVITSGREIQKVVMNNFAEKVNALGNTGTAPTIDLSNGTFVTATLSANATFAFSLGTGVTSDAISFTLHLTNDSTAGRTITWPVSVKWPNAIVPTRTTTASRTDVYTFYTFNGGTDWYGVLSIYNYS